MAQPKGISQCWTNEQRDCSSSRCFSVVSYAQPKMNLTTKIAKCIGSANRWTNYKSNVCAESSNKSAVGNLTPEPNVAPFNNACGSLAHTLILVDISSKHCKTANTPRTTFSSHRCCRLQVSCNSTEHWLSQCQTIVWFHVTPLSNEMALMGMHFKIRGIHGSLSQKGPKPPDIRYRLLSPTFLISFWK